MEIADAVKKLGQLDIGFYCTHDDYAGARFITLTEEQVLQYAEDPVGYLAKFYGVTKDEYLGWHRSGYRVQCAGKTRSGKRCRGSVARNIEPKEWAALQGSFCHQHA